MDMIEKTEINKRRINVRALATVRNYDGNRRVEKAISKTIILQVLFSQFFLDVPEQLQLEIVRQGNTGDKGPVITYLTGEWGEESEHLGLNMVKHRRSPL